MTGIEAIAAVSASAVADVSAAARAVAPQPVAQTRFQDILAAGLNGLENRVASANDMVRSFAVDDTVPIHQVSAAIEEARLAIEVAVQLRARFVESYRDIMNMQI